jgi:hypothetical protein
LISLQVKSDEPVDHVSLALQNLRHVDRYRAGCDAELFCARDDVGNVGAPDFILAGEAIDIRAGTTNPATLDYCRPLAGLSPG